MLSMKSQLSESIRLIRVFCILLLVYFMFTPLLVLVTSRYIAWIAVAVARKVFMYLLGGHAHTQKKLQKM